MEMVGVKSGCWTWRVYIYEGKKINRFSQAKQKDCSAHCCAVCVLHSPLGVGEVVRALKSFWEADANCCSPEGVGKGR
jgi:hypothetical protein